VQQHHQFLKLIRKTAMEEREDLCEEEAQGLESAEQRPLVEQPVASASTVAAAAASERSGVEVEVAAAVE
jgi:hypothetical protein